MYGIIAFDIIVERGGGRLERFHNGVDVVGIYGIRCEFVPDCGIGFEGVAANIKDERVPFQGLVRSFLVVYAVASDTYLEAEMCTNL